MMTEREICRSYSQARDLKQRVISLAKANNTTPEAIREILRRNGYAPPVMAQEKPVEPPSHTLPAEMWPGADGAMARTAKLVALVEQGTTVNKIAEEMGISYGQALTWVARICVLCEEYIAAAEGGSPT